MNYEKEQISENGVLTNREIIYIFAPDGLFAINETVIRHCKFQIGNCDTVLCAELRRSKFTEL